MAKTTAKQRRRLGTAAGPHEREFRRLRLSVCDDTGFRLYLATYDQPKRRDLLIRRIVREAEAEKVRVTRLDLAGGGAETSLVALLRAHLSKCSLRRGWRQAVMVTGIERRLDYSGGREGLAFLRQANLLRDALPDAAPVPVVLWLSRMASAILPAEAPDLWHWRAANFDFTGDRAPRAELLRELTMLQLGDGNGLSGEQREARSQVLGALLAELEREGPPKSKRQATERVDLILELAGESWALGDTDKALARFEQGLAIAQTLEDRKREAFALAGIGGVWQQTGKLKGAVESYEQALALVQGAGDRLGERLLLQGLAGALFELGEQHRSIAYGEQELALSRKIGDRHGEVNALIILGTVYAHMGERPDATQYFEEALATARKIGDLESEGSALNNLAWAYENLGEPLRAIELYEQALTIAQDTRDLTNRSKPFLNLGLIYGKLGEPKRAIEYFEQLLAIAPGMSDRRSEGLALLHGAQALDQLGRRGEAIEWMRSALRLYEQIDDPRQEDARAKLVEWQGNDVGGNASTLSSAIDTSG